LRWLCGVLRGAIAVSPTPVASPVKASLKEYAKQQKKKGPAFAEPFRLSNVVFLS
jgi:hypothetical protein